MVPAHSLDDVPRKLPLSQSFGAYFTMAASGKAHLHFHRRAAAIGEALKALLERRRHNSESQTADVVNQAGQKGVGRIHCDRGLDREQFGGLRHIQTVVPEPVRLWG